MDNLLLETADNLLQEDGISVLLLEQQAGSLSIAPSAPSGAPFRRGLVPDAPEYIVALPEVREKVRLVSTAIPLVGVLSGVTAPILPLAIATPLMAVLPVAMERASLSEQAQGSKRFDWSTAMPFYQEMAEVMAEQGDVRLLKALRAYKRAAPVDR